MKSAIYQVDAEGILDSTFNYFVKTGLENVRMRQLSKDARIALGSIYYWFDGKDNLIYEVTEYGLKKVVDQIFSYVFSNMKNLRKFFDECLSEIDKYKDQLRFIHQMSASPVYGGKIRSKGQDLNLIYDKYVNMLAEMLRCSTQELKPLVYLFISTVIDYVMWDDKEIAQMQLESIYSGLSEIMKTGSCTKNQK